MGEDFVISDAAIAEVRAVREHQERLEAERKPMEKKLSEISRSEWIAFQWVEIVQAFGSDDERMFRDNGKRTPAEALQAADEWDQTAEERAEFA